MPRRYRTATCSSSSRHFSVLGGARVRLERVPAGAIRAGAVLQGALVARFERPLTVDNFEGVAAVQGEGGETLVYILSDDNFNFLQRTLLLLFRLQQLLTPAVTVARNPG